MLKPPSKEQRRLLELAEFIENLDPEKFDMQKYGTTGEPRCMCGWFMHNHALACNDWREAGRLLGLSEEIATRVFCANLPRTTHEAAAELRHLAWVL